jgi:hypothetical protein
MEAGENHLQPAYPGVIRRYFSSGWAFFMPYLFFYLLYYWRKWPVNPLPNHTLGSGGHIPALLHVYWTLHALHLLLGTLALYTWWGQNRLQDEPTAGSPDFPLSRFSAFLPWLLLALIFYIPGPYLEFPSDPWMHLGRIIEWKNLTNIGTHSAWSKSSYFFAYSLLGKISAYRLFFWLDIYYTGACLLLCWQYFRLAEAVGLGKRAAFIFVLLQALLFGNSVFGFYRYYGISSSIFAQLGTIAMVRLGLLVAQTSASDLRSWALTIGHWALATMALTVFIAFHHGQALGIAILGLAAVAVWRFIKWKRTMIWWLVAATFGLSAMAILWWPHDPALDQSFGPHGVLTAWDGFNLFSLSSFAGDRMMQILGGIGVINLAAGVVLLCRNHVVGWLTIMPVLALSLPFVAIPLSKIIILHSELANIGAFHRMLFAIPAGLALVCLGEKIAHNAAKARISRIFDLQLVPLLVAISLLALTTTPANRPSYNHFWNALEESPDDLSMRTVWRNYCDHLKLIRYDQATTRIASTSGLGLILVLQTQYPAVCVGRTGAIPVNDLEHIHAVLKEPGHIVVIAPEPTICYTSYSWAAICSGHWLPQENILAFAGANELAIMSSRSNLYPANFSGKITFYQNK